jgi:hypothetical protein
MSGGMVRSSTCDDWQRGMDCAFDEWTFFTITAGLWLLTTLFLLAKAFLPLGDGSTPTGAGRWCLLSTAASSLCMSADAVSTLLAGPRGNKPALLTNCFLLPAVGTVFLGFGMRWFAWLWCTVSGALEIKAHPLAARLVCTVWWIYNFVAFLNVPVALVMAVSGTAFGPSFPDGVKVWMAWALLSTCLAFTIAAVLMWIVTTRCQSNETAARSLTVVTKINVAEQFIYNLTLVLAGALYITPAYNEYGMVQAAVFTLMVVPVWLMHIQMLIFFASTQSDDPLFSQKQLRSLLLLTSSELGFVAESTLAAVGVDGKNAAIPKPNKIGSPVPESAQPGIEAFNPLHLEGGLHMDSARADDIDLEQA